MFLMKMLDFLLGYVIISLRGSYAERFINICVRRGIRVWGIKRMGKRKILLCVHISDFKRLRSVARKTLTTVRIIKKRGLPILLYRYRKRYVLFAGAGILILFFAVMSQFVWIIEVNGNESIPAEEVLRAAKEAGVYEGAGKRGLKDVQAVRDSIMCRMDNITWAWVYIEGAKATIEIRERTLPPIPVDKNAACDIVAMRDALIKKITVKEGTTELKEGDAVLAGDTVISGTLYNNNGETVRYVHSIGTVEAATWHEKTGDYKLYNEIHIPTGNRSRKYTLKLFSKRLNLFFKEQVDYENYEVTEINNDFKIGNSYIGIGLCGKVYDEVTVEYEAVPEETVIECAKNELEEQIAKELIAGAVLTDSKLTCNKKDNNTVTVTVVMEFIEKIGTERPIQIQEEKNIAKTD